MRRLCFMFLSCCYSVTEDGGVDGLELLDTVRKGYDLGGADEGEVQGVEIHNHIFALQYKFVSLCWEHFHFH